ncbi:hypothetical protein HY844_02620 [Candidatus Berkelbacteria bacterium]|nr:hypothetical protein [Candidatus Berkelbacteria bacterium]
MRGVVGRGATYLVIFIYLISVSIFSFSFALSPEVSNAQSQAGDPIFEVTNNISEVIRSSKENLGINTRIKISEDGNIDETFAYFDIIIELKLDKSVSSVDYWEISKIKLLNLTGEPVYGNTNSKIISESIAEFYNRNNELITRLDYSNPLINSPGSGPSPCISISPSGTRDNKTLYSVKPVNMDNASTCTDKIFDEVYTNNTIAPISVVARNLFRNPVQPKNYDLSGDDTTDQERGKVLSWFKDGIPDEELQINISEDAGEPPYIDLRGDAQLGRPPIRFTLQHAGSEGELLVKNVDWLIFSANVYNAAKGVVEEEIKNLYMIFNDSVTGASEGTNIIYSTTGELIKSGKFNPDEILVEKFKINDEHRKTLYGYIMNAPDNNGDSCTIDTKDFKIVGVITKGAQVEQFKDSGNTLDPRNVDGNCLNTEASGWLAHWNVTSNSTPANIQKCGIQSFVTGGLGVIVEKFIKCMMSDVINPIVNWAIKWVEYAAGISYIFKGNEISIETRYS